MDAKTAAKNLTPKQLRELADEMEASTTIDYGTPFKRGRLKYNLYSVHVDEVDVKGLRQIEAQAFEARIEIYLQLDAGTRLKCYRDENWGERWEACDGTHVFYGAKWADENLRDVEEIKKVK